MAHPTAQFARREAQEATAGKATIDSYIIETNNAINCSAILFNVGCSCFRIKCHIKYVSSDKFSMNARYDLK